MPPVAADHRGRRPWGPRRVALIGRPNVGKSSLLNRLSREERAVVDSVGGTTVDPVDSLVEMDGEVWQFVDTAGLRKRVSHASGTEYYASLRTAGAVEAAEVAVVLLDAAEPISEQDQRVLVVRRRGRAGSGDRLQQVGPGRPGPPVLPRQGDRPRAESASPGPYASTSPAKMGRAVDKLAPALRRALAGHGSSASRPVPLNQWLTALTQATPHPVRGGRAEHLPTIQFVAPRIFVGVSSRVTNLMPTAFTRPQLLWAPDTIAAVQ